MAAAPLRPARDRRPNMRPEAAPAMVDAEYRFTTEDFRGITAMLRADAGISIAEGKATLVYSRLAKRLRALGLSSFQEYRDLVASPAGADERGHMLTALTTNVTRFFREPHHFEHLKQILRPLLEGARQGVRVRLWSAACSSGEEPYSMALTVLSLMPDAARFDIRILATDIDEAVIARGQAGRYDGAGLAAIPADLRRRWFTRETGGGDQWSVADEMRKLVEFRQLNLIGTWPMRGRFQALMCRNVVIYFDEATQAELWQRFTPFVDAGAYLYIGHSERLSGPAASCFETAGLTTYRRLAVQAP